MALENVDVVVEDPVTAANFDLLAETEGPNVAAETFGAHFMDTIASGAGDDRQIDSKFKM